MNDDFFVEKLRRITRKKEKRKNLIHERKKEA
jgi:hypothetical protein